MKNIVFKLSLKIICVAFAAMFGLAPQADAQPDSKTSPPLNQQEFDAVIAEVREMIKTDENLAGSFIVREATPERIERLFNMPEITQQPAVIRENGLIFAGQGKLLSFNKPSDIIGKVAAWFPKEVAAARARQEMSYFSYLHLYGPYPGWHDEPAAFLTLWNCMPRVAWAIESTQNPFMGRLNSRNPFMSITDNQSGMFDFGRCVRERSGRRSLATIKDNKIIKVDPRLYEQERHLMGMRVVPVLQTKFARFLAENRCTRAGADDCVLNLLMWSSLSADDPNLAHAIRDLERDIAPDSPLPALQTPSAKNPAGYEPRFDEYLRRAAFLRAKLLSVSSAKEAWPATALATTLQQITHLQLLYGEALSAVNEGWRVNQIYEIAYRNGELDPKYALTLDAGKTPAVQAAMAAALENIDSEAGCHQVNALLGNDPATRSEFALRHLIDHPFVCGVQPDWGWLSQGKSAQAQELRTQYLALLGTTESGALHETLLNVFTGASRGCFSQKDSPLPDSSARPDWLLKTCSAWVSEPKAVSLKLAHSPYSLSKNEQFQRVSVGGIPNKAGTGVLSEQQDAWLAGLVQGMDASVVQKMQAFAADLRARNIIVEAASLWSHPRHRTALITLSVYGGNEAPVLAISPDTFSEVHVSDRFGYSRVGGELAYVSDLDHDGNLEMWLGDTSHFCRQDDTDLQRNLDCSSNTAQMGEMYGDTLSYFANTPHPPGLRAMPLLKNVQPVIEPLPEENQHCNSILIGQVLVKKLKIDFGGGERNRGDVIDLVCKPHPLHPGQIIVALFYDLPGAQNGLEQKGFALAVLDMARKKVLRLYTDTIEEDASIRVQEYGLHIDTARYNLAPGVRALGVRMNIGYSPRCAEGGESNYLTLFVEEGRQFRPILKNFAMSSWSITDGSNNCGYGDAKYTMDNLEYTLAVSDTSTDGWRDLELTAHHTIERTEEKPDDSTSQATDPGLKPQVTTQLVGKFRAKNKNYFRF